MRKLDYQVYLDKVLGCWYGKSIGGTVGAPVEGHKMLANMTVDNCWPDRLYPNDDLDIQVVWLEMLEEIGVYPTKYDYVNFWRDRCWYNFCEYGSFLLNAQLGIHPPLSGEFNNEFFSECEGCPIRAEVWGAVAPGDIELAAELARIDGELDHIGISVDAEMFWAAAVSEAFFTEDMWEAMAAGRSVIDDDCLIAEIYDNVPVIYEELKGNIPLIWRKLVRMYGHRDNSKAETNFAFSILALIACKGDFKEAIVQATNYGWDSDCTAATVGALLGTLTGMKGLPADWIEKMGPRLACDCNVRHKTDLMVDFAADTCKVGVEMLERNIDATIENIPADVLATVAERKASRRGPAELTWDIDYCGDPTLPIEGEKEVFISLQAVHANRITLTASSENTVVMLDREVIAPMPGEPEIIGVTVVRKESDIIWDKNLITITASVDGEKIGEFEFGLMGQRPFVMYGPYWHAWDAEESEICPFKNDELITHPCNVDCGMVLSNNYVYLDKEYLDEKALAVHGLPEEGPELITANRDWFWTGEKAGYVGECVYYFVKEIVTSKDTEAVVARIGCDSPIEVWLDGEKVGENKGVSAWTYNDIRINTKFYADKPIRMLIKVARKQDDARLSFCVIKDDVPGDKLKGDSYLIDTMGSKIIKG